MKNTYLVGFMGCGKTAVAKGLAHRLNRPFIDMDEEISNRQGCSIKEIFAARGEAYFRSLEAELVRELSLKSGWVVACGGGTFASQENIDLLKKSGLVICLTSKPEVIFKRVKADQDRPLLQVDDPLSAIELLLSKREPFYSQAHHSFDCSALTVDETVDGILREFVHG